MAVLRILQEKNVKATFFFTGENAQKYPDDVRAVAEAGNQVGNHTFDHKYPPQVPGGWTLAHLKDQISRTDTILGDLINNPICAFRPPGGYTENVVKAANKELENVYMWSDDSVDWKQRTAVNLEDTADIFRKATDIEQRENPIVLMHTNTSSSEHVRNVPSNRDNTVAALPKIIDWYEEKGFTFVTLDGRTS